MMTPETLQSFLHHHIPASATLGVGVAEVNSKTVTLTLPLAGNNNHHHSVFGGSMALVATLSGWSLVHIMFPEAAGNIVIQTSQLRYLKPARGNLSAKAYSDDDAAQSAAATLFAKHGKARIDIHCTLFSEDETVAEFTGRYVIQQPK